MKKFFRYTLSPEEGGFVARCLDVDVASDGYTEEAAVANLIDALELHYENVRIGLQLTTQSDTDEDADDSDEAALAEDGLPEEDEDRDIQDSPYGSPDHEE